MKDFMIKHQIHDVKGDGACFFRSISNSYFDDHVYHSIQQDRNVIMFKQKILTYLDLNPELFVLCPYHKIIYPHKLLNNEYWGGEFEAYIISKLLNINITIVSNQLQHPQEYISDLPINKRTIYLYHQGSHYQSIEPNHNLKHQQINKSYRSQTEPKTIRLQNEQRLIKTKIIIPSILIFIMIRYLQPHDMKL